MLRSNRTSNVHMILNVFTDGGSLNNPGQAAIAFVIYQDGQLIEKFSQKIGSASNNFAEYSALIKALEKIKQMTYKKNSSRVQKICIFSDSQLIVNQVNGIYKVKNAAIREFVIKIRILEQEIGLPIIYKNIPREKNRLADSLVKKELIPVSELA